MLAFVLAVALLSPAKPTPADACIQELNGVLQRNDFARLVDRAEQCRVETGHPRTLYFAALGHLGLQNLRPAIVMLQAYLAQNAPDEPVRIREVAALRLRQAKENAGSVALRIEPSPEGEVELVVVREDQEASPLSLRLPDLEPSERGPLLWLDRGRYQMTIRTRGYLPNVVSVTVDAQEVTLPVKLRRPSISKPVAREAVFPRRPWLGGTFAGVGGLLASGIPLSFIGAKRVESWLALPSEVCLPVIAICRRGVAAATRLRGPGAGLLGAGLGVAAGSLIALASKRTQRRVGWVVEAAVGGVFVVVGIGFIGSGLPRFNETNTDSGPILLWGDRYLEEVRAFGSLYTVGNGLLGAGIGLGATAITGLLLDRRGPRRVARWHLQSTGLVLRF